MIKKNPKSNEPKKNQTPEENIVDIDLSPIQKKPFRLDGDNSRIIRLNTSDLNIASRLEKTYPKLLELTRDASNKLDEVDNSDSDTKSDTIKLLAEIDKQMRDLVDYVFDEKVADKAVPNGSMYDPFNGKFAFEYVIEKLAELYETNFSQEVSLMQKRMNKHTEKYTGKK